MSKSRLDLLLVEQGLVESRSKAQALIMAGKVQVNGQVRTKAGMPTPLDAVLTVEQEMPYVSRGGLKLEAAFDSFAVSPLDAICADVGASTGGFTHVLLERGAALVYAIDVGYGQLAWSLRQDERVVVMERTNARHLTHLPQPVSLVTIDASFISLRLILPAVVKWLAPVASVIALVKPQFEAGKGQVGKGGVVRDRAVHEQVLRQVADYARQNQLAVLNLIPSPITGPAGNHEFLIQLGWHADQPALELGPAIEQCLAAIEAGLP